VPSRARSAGKVSEQSVTLECTAEARIMVEQARPMAFNFRLHANRVYFGKTANLTDAPKALATRAVMIRDSEKSLREPSLE